MAGIYTIAERIDSVAESIEKLVSETNPEEAEDGDEQ
jgi:hypothetical protein